MTAEIDSSSKELGGEMKGRETDGFIRKDNWLCYHRIILYVS